MGLGTDEGLGEEASIVVGDIEEDTMGGCKMEIGVRVFSIIPGEKESLCDCYFNDDFNM
jgi:hypothetical protein